MDYNRNQLYFNPIPKKSFETGVIFAIVGIIILIVGINLGVVGIVIGLVVIGLGVLLIVKTVNYNKNRTIITDAEIDTTCADHLKNLKSMAIKKHSIDEDQVKEYDPLQFEGYYYERLPNAAFQYKKGDDGKLRSSNYNAVMFLFSSEQVFCYEYKFSLLEDKKQEKTDEYFYKDIVSVSTQSDAKTHGDVTFNFEYFKLTTSGGTTISAQYSVTGETEDALKAMKNLLRNKK